MAARDFVHVRALHAVGVLPDGAAASELIQGVGDFPQQFVLAHVHPLVLFLEFLPVEPAPLVPALRHVVVGVPAVGVLEVLCDGFVHGRLEGAVVGVLGGVFVLPYSGRVRFAEYVGHFVPAPVPRVSGAVAGRGRLEFVLSDGFAAVGVVRVRHTRYHGCQVLLTPVSD